MSSKWKSSIPVAGFAAAAALAFPAIASADVTASVEDGVLTVTGAGADAITISCDGDDNVAVANATLADPALCDTITAIEVTGGDGANVITLTDVTAGDYPDLELATIDAGEGNDQIFGSEQIDEMHGGPGNDQIIGDDNPPGTRDVFEGEAGDDLLIWRGGEDDDTMNGGDGADTVQVQGAGLPESFAVKPGTTGRVTFDRIASAVIGGFNLDIGTAETLDLNAGGGDDVLATELGTGPGFKLDVSGGDGNDTLDAGDAADLITGDAGNDTITPDDNPAGSRDIAQGGDGDDSIIWNGGDDDDINDGGAGSDTVVVNGAGAPEAFSLVASTTAAGHATFDRAATPGPGPFNIDIVTAEVLDLRANGGDDAFTSDGAIAALGLRVNVTGGDGNDTLDGSDAADLIDGGAGNDRINPDDNPAGTRDDARGGDGDDTIIWNGGDDDDLNEGGAGNDTSLINGANADEIFTINPSETDGRVLFDRLASPGPGAFSVDMGTTEVLHLEANAGNDRVKGAKGVAGRISTILNTGDGNDRVKGTDAVDAISLGAGSDFANAIDKAEDTVSCDSGLDLAVVDKRDFVRQCDLVVGGRARVAIKGKARLDDGTVAVRVKCVATQTCKSAVKLKAGGKTLGRAKATMKRGKNRTIEVALNARGRRVLSDGDRVKVQVVSKDREGNGWRSSKKVRLG